jgi:hypothetical protein
MIKVLALMATAAMLLGAATVAPRCRRAWDAAILHKVPSDQILV